MSCDPKHRSFELARLVKSVGSLTDELASRFRDAQLLADSCGDVVVDLPMPRNRRLQSSLVVT